MIALGIDAEDIARFAHWNQYCEKRLSRIFTKNELAYCLAIPTKSAERFAVRWASKEACYKALNAFFTQQISYSFFCKQIEVTSNGKPALLINWHALALPVKLKESIPLLALTHTQQTAIAVVIFT